LSGGNGRAKAEEQVCNQQKQQACPMFSLVEDPFLTTMSEIRRNEMRITIIWQTFFLAAIFNGMIAYSQTNLPKNTDNSGRQIKATAQNIFDFVEQVSKNPAIDRRKEEAFLQELLDGALRIIPAPPYTRSDAASCHYYPGCEGSNCVECNEEDECYCSNCCVAATSHLSASSITGPDSEGKTSGDEKAKILGIGNDGCGSYCAENGFSVCPTCSISCPPGKTAFCTPPEAYSPPNGGPSRCAKSPTCSCR
jgi:hypothetical protein